MDPTIIQPDSKWQGFEKIRYLMVFGDSYSAIGDQSWKHTPSDDEPLGIRFPGFTYTGDVNPNWVGYLVTEYCQSKLLVYSYAQGGHTCNDLVRQVRGKFLPTVGKKPPTAPWTAENALFVTWIGINDVGIGFEPVPSIQLVMDLQTELYDVGARNFLFINVPPLPKPLSRVGRNASVASRRKEWNDTLVASIEKFYATHPQSSVFLFDAHSSFTRMFENPSSYGFAPDAGQAFDNQMYWDHIHPKSAVHAVIAKELGGFLSGKSLV